MNADCTVETWAYLDGATQASERQTQGEGKCGYSSKGFNPVPWRHGSCWVASCGMRDRVGSRSQQIGNLRCLGNNRRRHRCLDPCAASANFSIHIQSIFAAPRSLLGAGFYFQLCLLFFFRFFLRKHLFFKTLRRRLSRRTQTTHLQHGDKREDRRGLAFPRL